MEDTLTPFLHQWGTNIIQISVAPTGCDHLDLKHQIAVCADHHQSSPNTPYCSTEQEYGLKTEERERERESDCERVIRSNGKESEVKRVIVRE